ncbi:unnamed protein product [Calypogeia fissa]
MRGGRYQQKATEDVNFRNAEALFETRSVVEIREVEVQTRKEIEEKKEELRQLVGASYRDLIESADSILLMRQSCEAVADNIQKMEVGFESLKSSISLSSVSSESAKERQKSESLFGLGGRVKYLVDTPEKIWGCLDEHMYLEGSERYLRAKEVHSLLTATPVQRSELFATFPLLRHQWPLVRTFRGQIPQRSRDRLQEPGFKVVDYAIALAAIGIIEELPATQIFSLFLETRRMWLRVHLRSAIAGTGIAGSKFHKRNSSRSGGETGIADLLQKGEKVTVTGSFTSDTESIAASLCKLGHMIQASLCHVGELFLEVSGKMPLLFSTLLTAPPGSQLFGGIPNPEREVGLWKAHREKLEMSMVPLSAKLITESCISWLAKCAAEIIAEGKCLLQHVKTGKELAEIERVVREDLAKQAALSESLEWLKSAFGSSFDSPWDCLCELLLKEPTSLWEVLFENMFVSRMKEVIDAGFRSISIDDVLDEVLSSSRNSVVEGFLVQVEKRQSTENGRSSYGRGVESFGSLSSFASSGGSVWKSMVDDKDSCSSFLSRDVTKLKDRVDERLRDVLEDSLCFFQGPQRSSRTDELASYLQEQCRLCMTSIVKVLSDRLAELSENMKKVTESSRQVDSLVKDSNDGSAKLNTSNSMKASNIVEKALFLGRLSAALGQHTSYLPIILGSPSQWSARLKAVSLKGSTGLLGSKSSSTGRDLGASDSSDRWYSKKGKTGNMGNGDISPKLRELQRMLRQKSIDAHSIWASWSADELGKSFYRDLANDDCLSTSTSLKGWEDTVLRQEEEGGGAVEMKLALPAMPSPYAVSILFAGCQEIYRVGGHALDRAVLKLFAYRLCEKIFSSYETFLSDPSVFSTRVSEKGLLQLLFDLRFMADILSGGQDVTSQDLEEDKGKDLGVGAVTRSKVVPLQPDASALAMKRRGDSLMSTVFTKLDPIDWATYEQHLWENVTRHYQRCAVLFGSVIQLNRLYTDVPLRPSSQGDANTLNMAGGIPRFTYLPISAPVLSVSGGPGSRVPRTATQDDSATGSWNSYKNGDDSYKYGADAPSQSSNAGARPLKNFLMGQWGGSRFGEGLKLGLLSDGQVERFRGKGAAAISTFGDMLPVQAGALFSSLTAGTNKE